MPLRKGLYYITIHENVFSYFKVMTVQLLPLITKLILKKKIFPFNGDDHNLMFICIFMLCHCVLAAQSCLTLCNPTDCSSPGSSVHGILQARILE